MEEEKKKMSKETKKFLIIISSFIAVVIIVGIVFGVVFPQLNKKEVQTSSQLENENIQEEKKEENTIPDNLEISNNANGMRFKMTISDFVEKYNKVIEKTEEETLVPVFQIKESDISYLGTNDTSKMYGYTRYVGGNMANSSSKARFAIGLYLEKDSDKIVQVSFVVDNEYLNSINREQQTSLFSHSLPQVMMAIDNKLTMESAFERVEKATNNVPHIFFNNNICLAVNSNDEVITYTIAAMSNEVYNKMFNNSTNSTTETSTNTNTSSNTNSTVIEDIQDRIDFFNSYYYWNFHPTNEQMQQMVEFANSTSNFTNDTLADFIIDKGWLPDSGTGTVSSNNSSSTTNNGNSSSSNKNTSSSSNDDDNTNREVIATVNINLKELIAKNTVATEIKNESERIDIRVYVEDAFVKDDYFEYFSGGASVPNTITTTVKVYENEKKLNDKRKVIITMDNTRTLIKETTLYDGEMIFNKTGTYEIK